MTEGHEQGSRLLVGLAGLFGAAGVVLAALASHAGGEALLRPASTICLAHAPVLLVLGLIGRKLKFGPAAGIGMAIGTALFSGDLVARQFLGSGLFPMAAPTGGLTLIGSWLALSASGLIGRRG